MGTISSLQISSGGPLKTIFATLICTCVEGTGGDHLYWYIYRFKHCVEEEFHQSSFPVLYYTLEKIFLAGFISRGILIIICLGVILDFSSVVYKLYMSWFCLVVIFSRNISQCCRQTFTCCLSSTTHFLKKVMSLYMD